MKSSCTEAPTGRSFSFFSGTCLDVLACFGLFVGLWFCFVRAEKYFCWSLLLRLATQVLAPGAGDVASALTSRAASAVGRPSPYHKIYVSF